MPNQITIIINQIIVFSILMSIGFLSAKLYVITKEALTYLSNIIVKIVLPALIFSMVADNGAQPEDFLIICLQFL